MREGRKREREREREVSVCERDVSSVVIPKVCHC